MKLNKFAIGTVAVIALVVVAVVVARNKAAHAASETQYKLTAVTVGEVKKTVSATGTLQPWTTVDIKSKAGGRVNQLLVDQGTVVHSGQILARIDPTDTLLAVNTAKAGVTSSRAKEQQSAVTYHLQVQQSQIAIQNARAALAASIASRDAAKARLNQARLASGAQPGLTNSSIKSAQANYNNAVQQRRQLDSTDKQDKATAQAAFDQATANEKNAQAALSRQQTLLAKGFVAQQAVDAAQAAESVAASQVASAAEKLHTIDAEQEALIAAADARTAQAQAQLQNSQATASDIPSKRQALAEAQANYDQSVAQVGENSAALNQAIANQANNSIKNYDITQAQASVSSAAATLQNAASTLDQTTVRSPSDGIILQKYVEPGTIITSGLSLNSTGTSIVQLGDISRMYVDAQVDEADLAGVDQGQHVDVSFDAYPGITFDGTVSRINPLAQVVQNVTVFDVRVEIDNSAPSFRLLLPGMNASCDFVKEKKDDVLTVPNEAVQTDDDGGSYVEIAKGGHPAPADPKLGLPADPDTIVEAKIEKQKVEVGTVGNDTTEITSGLKEGEKVVVSKIDPTPTQSSAPAGSPFGGGGGARGGGGSGRRGG